MATRVFTGAEVIANATPAGVKTEAKKGILHKPKAALVREPGSMDQGAGTYDKEKVLVARESELGGGRKAGSKEGDPSKFTIQAEAEATLIDTVQDFVLHLDNPVLAANLEPWQKDFIKQFKINAANTSSAAYDPSRLHQYAEAFVRTNEGVIAALKIAEWKIALYQKATGVQMHEIQSHMVVHNPDIIASGVDEEIQTQERNILQKLFKKGFSPLEQAKRDKAKADKKRPVNQRDRNYYTRATFTNPNVLKYDGTVLTQGQQAYLQSVGINAAGGASEYFTNGATSGSRNASAEQVRLGQILENLTNARIAVYEATGKFNIDVNLVDGGGNYIGTPERYLRIEHTATGANAHAAIENQLRAATTEMTKKNKEVAKAAAKKVKEAKAAEKKRKSEEAAQIKKEKNEQRKNESVGLTVHLIEDKKAELSRGAAPVAVDAQKTIDTNTETITTETKKATDLHEAIAKGKQIPDLTKAVADAKAEMPNFDQVEIINQDIDIVTGIPKPGSLQEAVENHEAAQATTAEATRKVADAKKAREDAARNLAGLKPGSDAAVRQALIDINTAAQGVDITALETAVATAQAAEKTAKREMDRRTRVQTQNADKWQAYQDAQTALETVQREYAEIIARHAVVPAVAGPVLESDITTAINAAEVHIKTLQHDNEKLLDPDKLAREHQLAAYEELSAVITPPEEYQKMQQRIEELTLKKKEPLIEELHVAGIYEQYPPVYLRALQVTFGWDITDYSKAAEFQKATKLLTPQMFLDTLDPALLQEPNPAPPPATIRITDPYDPQLFDPARMRALSSKNMSAFADTLLDNASKGTLGQLTQAEIAEREAMQVRDGSDIFVAPIIPADRNALVQTLTQDIYHYEDVDDLARIIFARHAGAVNGTARINNADDAKAYAKEIVRMRNVVI